MKKTRNILFLLLICAAPLIWAQNVNYLPGFAPLNPRIMGMGGDVAADPDGFTALLSNPAGFVGEKTTKKVKEKDSEGNRIKVEREVTETEFTLLSIQGALIANPFAALRTSDALQSGTDPLTVIIDYAIGELETNGLGLGVDLSLASYVGNGWGFGTFISAGALFPQSDLALATEGRAMIDGTFQLGYAHPFELPFGMELTVGGDVRPTYRVIVPMSAGDLLSMTTGVGGASAFNLTHGFGIAFDLGTTLEWKDLTGALVLKDLFHTRYMMYENPLDKFGDFSSSAASDDVYFTPMSLTFGVGYEPDLPLIGWLVKPSLVASYKTDLLIGYNPLDVYDYTRGTFFKSLHLGLETKWLNMVYLRAGLNQGYFTAGTGIDFFIGEFNMALFSQETGRTAGQSSQLGMAVELAFRW